MFYLNWMLLYRGHLYTKYVLCSKWLCQYLYCSCKLFIYRMCSFRGRCNLVSTIGMTPAMVISHTGSNVYEEEPPSPISEKHNDNPKTWRCKPNV